MASLLSLLDDMLTVLMGWQAPYMEGLKIYILCMGYIAHQEEAACANLCHARI